MSSEGTETYLVVAEPGYDYALTVRDDDGIAFSGTYPTRESAFGAAAQWRQPGQYACVTHRGCLIAEWYDAEGIDPSVESLA